MGVKGKSAKNIKGDIGPGLSVKQETSKTRTYFDVQHKPWQDIFGH